MRPIALAALVAALFLIVAASEAQPPAKNPDPKAKTDPKADPKAKTDPKAKEPEQKFNLKLKVDDIVFGNPVMGPKMGLQDVKSHAVLYDMWGINCPPCLAAMPHTSELYAELEGFGLIIIGAHSQGGEAEKVRAVAIQHHANFPIQVNAHVKGSEDNKFLPHCILFDHTGACIFRGQPTDVEALVRKAVGAALVAAAGRDKWSSQMDGIIKDLKAGKPPAGILARVAAYRTAKGDLGEDATALLKAMTAAGTKKLEEATSKKDSEPLEAFLLIEKVPTIYKGAPLATEANELLNKLKGDKAVKAELAARPALEKVKQIDQQLGLGADDPRKPEWQKAHKEPLKQLKDKVSAMKKSWPDAHSTQEAVAIADRYGVELK
ncbi:MAG TPA: TlpA disulfide reductase family protein [Gemmataceae bacterium]|jgi:thiol-disulfide isomerase/thioredoxin|nr:TlpA disulfide reductase family protein [Gemmataceae bacterium]